MRVAIVGAGPAGSALAILLAREGAHVTLFDDGRHPVLLVGESLVPAVVPILKRLDLEKETASFSRIKPGVSFIWSQTDRVSVTFDRFAPAVFPYAYNVPRPLFDDALLAKAIASGVDYVTTRAQLQPNTSGETRAELRLAPATIASAPGLSDQPPDLIVDATGRARLAARALGIAARLGPRKDVAHFAHFEAFSFIDPMLSPGVFLALRSAEQLADGLAPWLRRRATPSPAELDSVLASYAAVQNEMLSAWLELVAYLYDGRLAALIQAGRTWMPANPGLLKRAMQRHIARHVGLLASGAATTSRYSRGLLRFLGRYGLRGVNPEDLAIR